MLGTKFNGCQGFNLNLTQMHLRHTEHKQVWNH